MRAKRWRVAIIAALVAVLLGVQLGGPDGVDPAAAAPTAADLESAQAGPADVLPAGGHWTVTLLTGEVVDVHADADGRVTAATREHESPYRTVRKPNGDVYLIPLAVTGLLDGVLDMELFNVTGLVRQGYDDESIDSIPLIVQREPGVDVHTTLQASDETPLPSIGASAVRVPKARTMAAGDQIRRADDGSLDGFTKVWLDRRIETSRSPVAPGRIAQTAGLDGNLTQIGADQAWEAGLTGEGVSVAVLDTGIDPNHPDLTGKIVAERNFSDAEDAVDHFGHGSHVAALAAGSGAGADGARAGVARDANLLNGKVLDDFGFGFESWVIAGMEWAAPQADIINMSVGGPPFPGQDPLSMALDALAEQHGTLFVVAAGNSGPVSQSIDTPGVADKALTVGAVNAEDALADFSSRSPVPPSWELKPEVLAPGVDIVSARAAGTAMGEPVDDNYTSASGTSMATPHVAGAAAILAQQHPDWTADQIRNTLVGTSDEVEGDGWDVGAGRIDLGEGITTGVHTSTDVVEVTLPHPRTEPHREPLEWVNESDEAVTLELEAEIADREGDEVDGASIEPEEITVPAHGTAEVAVAMDGPNLESGLYAGAITAQCDACGADDGTMRTPLAIYAAPEMVDLTIESTPPPENPVTPTTFAAIVNLDDYGEFNSFAMFEEASYTVEVPAGRYAVVGDVTSGDFGSEVVAQVGDPELDMTAPRTVQFDGEAAVPMRPTVPGAETAPPRYSMAELMITPTLGTSGYGLMSAVFAWHPMPALRLTAMEGDEDHFAASQTFRLQAPHLTGRVGDDSIEVTDATYRQQLAAGDHTFTAVDAGDGSDLSGASGRLAVVQLPDDPAPVVQRAVEAGVAVLAFVDVARPTVAIDAGDGVPLIAAGGESAARLRTAGVQGEEVTVTSAASPYVYDIERPFSNEVVPEGDIDRRTLRRLATIDERFHRDVDGTGSDGDQRYALSSLMNVSTAGPLPEERTAYVTPDVGWHSMVLVDNLAISQNAGEVYEPRSHESLTWLRRPQWPGPVGGPLGVSYCQPTPVERDAGTMYVWLAPFQDGLDRYGCADPTQAALTLEHDGESQTVDRYYEAFSVPSDETEYRLTYEQEGAAPYVHRSSTAWTFSSAAPSGDEPEQLPLMVVDYQLPLDTLNQPTGSTATLSVGHVTGSDAAGARISRPLVWTSVDDGATWVPAEVRRHRGKYQVTLPTVDSGTGVSLRVDASDRAGNRIEQTLIDAYFA